MKLTESFVLALQNIRNGKMRAFLTMLGIIIGISAVMVIIGLGNGMELYMTDMFESIGTNTLSVTITGQGTTRKLSVDDMYEIVENNPDFFSDLTPTVTMRGTVKVGTETLDSTTATGVAESFFNIKDYQLAKGRSLRYVDMVNRTRVCVVGSYVDDVWYDGEAVGQTIRIGSDVFTIVGVLAPEEDDPDEGGTDDAVYLPYSTAARISNMGTISSYTVTVVSEDVADPAVDVLENALYQKLRSDKAYMVISMAQILDMMNDMINVMITILAVIAGISLVVGGVGIMNIMLVSVTERTREIGIRKALGAKERYILTQFVIEAAVISAIGGAIGIAFGYLFSSIATALISAMMEVEMMVTPTLFSITLAFGASAAIGIVFGYLPARKAAVLNPIDALRYD
ncbi:MAG: FtsX-like permease family protein [Ruminococcaceae bacterium]|nr:FtsX-like permease family protein [Oscillospiraceae bacterium]